MSFETESQTPLITKAITQCIDCELQTIHDAFFLFAILGKDHVAYSIAPNERRERKAKYTGDKIEFVDFRSEGK